MAEHDIEKIVEAGGEVFNFRDPTKQPVADRVTSWSSTPSDTKYPSEKLVKDSLDGKMNTSDVDASLSTTSTNPLQNKEITRWINLIIGDDGYVSGSSANPQLSLEKVRLGAVSLYNKGVTVKIYSFAENDEANAVLRWDSSAATGDVKTNYDNGLQTGTLYQSTEGECVKITYTGSTSSYFRALGIFMDTRDTGSGSTKFRAFVRVNNVDYPHSDLFNTFDSLVVAAYSGTPRASAEVILKPYNSSSRCRIYGFRCLNTYTGSDDAVLIGTSTNATKLRNARKLAVSLSNTSTDTSFNGSADVTNIKTTGTLGVGNGGTGRTSVTSGNYVVGAGTSAMVEKTPKEVGSDVLSSLDDKSNASSYADFVDDDFVIGSDHVDASTISSSTFVRRTAIKLWNYINGKISSVLGLTANSYGGNAATATKATQDSDGSAINTTYKKLAGSNKFTEPQYIDNDSRSSYQDLRIGNASKLVSIGISGPGNFLLKELTGRTNSPNAEKSIIYTFNGGTEYFFNGKATTAGTADALADDSAYVHKSGSETISGTKTFTAAEVNSESTAGDYSGFFVKRTATSDSNHVYKVSLEVDKNGNRGMFDYGGSGFDGSNRWIIRRDNSSDIRIGSSSDKVYVAGKCFDFSGTIGSDSNTFYLG